MYDRQGKLVDRREFLKVKVKSLAAEARIIRKMEKKTRGGIREGLHLHRVLDVRKEARASHLAYGFIRGRTLAQMEQKSKTPPNWAAVERMCKRYGPANFSIDKFKAPNAP